MDRYRSLPGFFFLLLALARGRAAAAAGTTDIRSGLPVTDGPVDAMAVDQAHGLLYIAGEFTQVAPADNPAGAVGRSYLAAIDLASGTATEWNPNPDQPVRALALSADGATLFVGGDFDAVGGQIRHKLAALRTDTGVPTDQWIGGADGTVDALLISSTGTTVYAGGSFANILCVVRPGLAELTISGSNGSCGGTGFANELGQGVAITGDAVAVRALAQADDRLYVGGSFSQVAGQPRSNLAAFDVNSFAPLSWAPGTIDGPVEALQIIPGKAPVYVGGAFTNVAGVPHAGLAALDPADAHALDWDPVLRLAGAASGVAVQAIVSSLDRSVLYVGGEFDSAGAGAAVHRRLAALRAADAEVIDDWQVDVDAGVRALFRSESGADDAPVYTVYAGGGFTQVDGAPRRGLVGADALPPETDPPATTATPAGGLLNSQTLTAITLSCDDGDGSGCAGTYFTLDGTTPTTASTLYTTPISITASAVLRFFSVDNMGNREAPKSETYTVETTPPQTTASPVSEVFFTRALSVTLSCTDNATGCAATYYTTDGSQPTTGSKRYTGPITLTGTTVLQFFSVDGAGNAEGIQRQEYAQNRGKAGALSPLEAGIGIAMAAVFMVRRRRGHG